jgi:hypothetical protein
VPQGLSWRHGTVLMPFFASSAFISSRTRSDSVRLQSSCCYEQAGIKAAAEHWRRKGDGGDQSLASAPKKFTTVHLCRYPLSCLFLLVPPLQIHQYMPPLCMYERVYSKRCF